MPFYPAPSVADAPSDATYITQTTNGTLSAEQAIGALASGILRGATTTGVITSLGDVLPVANGGTALTSFLKGINDFRLTLSTGVPETVSDVTAATNIFLTPGGRGNHISLYNGSEFQPYATAQVDCPVPSTVYRLFDIFAFVSGGVVDIETLDWNQTTKTITAASNASPIVITATGHGFATGATVRIANVGGNTAANGIWAVTSTGANTFSLDGTTGNGAYTSGGTAYQQSEQTRATALSLAVTGAEGVWTKTGVATRRYVGTGMTGGTSGQMADSLLNRHLWNYYNQVKRALTLVDGTNHTYTTASYRRWRAQATNVMEIVMGMPGVITANMNCKINNSADAVVGRAGAGMDSGTAVTSVANNNIQQVGLGSPSEHLFDAAGLHFINPLQQGGTTTTYDDMRMTGSVMG